MTTNDDIAFWCLAISIFLSVLFSLITGFVAAYPGSQEKKTFKQKCCYWVAGVLSVTFWIYGPFILYLLYLIGTKVVASINYMQRTEQVIPKTPEVIDLNKAEKTR